MATMASGLTLALDILATLDPFHPASQATQPTETSYTLADTSRLVVSQDLMFSFPLNQV